MSRAAKRWHFPDNPLAQHCSCPARGSLEWRTVTPAAERGRRATRIRDDTCSPDSSCSFYRGGPGARPGAVGPARRPQGHVPQRSRHGGGFHCGYLPRGDGHGQRHPLHELRPPRRRRHFGSSPHRPGHPARPLNLTQHHLHPRLRPRPLRQVRLPRTSPGRKTMEEGTTGATTTAAATTTADRGGQRPTSPGSRTGMRPTFLTSTWTMWPGRRATIRRCSQLVSPFGR